MTLTFCLRWADSSVRTHLGHPRVGVSIGINTVALSGLVQVGVTTVAQRNQVLLGILTAPAAE